MTSADELPADERKRQREALRRRMGQPGTSELEPLNLLYPWVVKFPLEDFAGLRPGLLQKYQAASSSAAKFELLKAFILDPENMSTIVIETEYEDMAKREDTSQWKELPLHELRKLYVSDEAKQFLETNIVGKQPGRNHPQDPYGENKEMKLYWVFQESTDTTSNSKKVGHRLKATAAVPTNKAALSALGDGLTTVAATSFHGKGSQERPGGDETGGGKGGKGKTKTKTNKGEGKTKGEGKGKDKNKAGLRLSNVIFNINTNMNNI